jgi:hypothetical protein
VNATTVVDAVRDIIDESPPTNAAADASTDGPPGLISASHQPPDNATSPGDSHPPEQATSNDQAATTVEASAISASDSSMNGPALDKETPPTEPGVAVSTGAITNSPPPEVHTSVKRPVLDESGASLESVLAALKTQNTERIETSVLPGEYAVLTNTDPVASTRIITSIGINCVNSVFLSLASALEIEKRRLREDERNRLSQIMEGRKQMALYSRGTNNEGGRVSTRGRAAT